MWGDNDAWIPVENAKLFAEKIPNVKVDIMKDTGHIPMEERPEESLKLFVDFIKIQSLKCYYQNQLLNFSRI